MNNAELPVLIPVIYPVVALAAFILGTAMFRLSGRHSGR